MSEWFFPNPSREAESLERAFREEMSGLPDEVRLRFYERFSGTLPSFVPTTYVQQDGLVFARQDGVEIAFPAPMPLVKFSHITFGYEQWLQRMYMLPDFVEVEEDDVVVDCGAYVGGFSLSAAKLASQLHAFEPDPANYRCLTRNLEKRSNVILNEAALFNETRSIRFNIAGSSVAHSLLKPEDVALAAQVDVPVYRLDEYCSSHGISALDFVKIEASGVELKVFEGLGTLRPRKLAIDLRPERDGRSLAQEFKRILGGMGYDVQQRAHMLFARLSDVRTGKPTTRRVPKVIYSLWSQGRPNAPALVNLCLERWERLNPDYELRVLEQSDVEALLGAVGLPKDTASIQTPIQAISDMVRSRLLEQHGGIWVDATVLPIKPLDAWLPELMAESGYFAFDRPGWDRLISSWFLAAAPGNYLAEAHWRETARIWDVPRLVAGREETGPADPAASVSPEVLCQSDLCPYYWFHYAFAHLLRTDPAAVEAWSRCAKISAEGPHSLQRLFSTTEDPSLAEMFLAVSDAPVQKLNWRFEYPLDRMARSTVALSGLGSSGEIEGEDLRVELARRHAELLRLAGEVESLEAQLLAIGNTLSWKITKPLRTLRRLV